MTDPSKTRILIFGASGMLGSAIYRALSANTDCLVFGTVRDSKAATLLKPSSQNLLIPNIHMEGESGIVAAFAHAKPHIVVNCIGIIKQLPSASDHLESLAINASLPHRLAKYCDLAGARLIHFSTDCVFSGEKGQYREEDYPDAYDLYGRTKFLGEVSYPNTVTLRTSIIGHELASARSLVDWFLSQSHNVKGFRRAIFSGLPTIEIARVIREYIIPNIHLSGLYHLSVEPINKYDLLMIVSDVYSKDIGIEPNDHLVIDRSLNSDRFRKTTGYKPPSWFELIQAMHSDYSSWRLSVG
jgi:dTDP-4-dehydrorhamnose reductase